MCCVSSGVMARAVTGVREQNLGLAADLAPDCATERVHAVAGLADILQIDVIGREISLALIHKAVTCEIDQDAVFFLRHRWQPRFQFALDVGAGGLGTSQLMDVLGAKVAALGADQNGINGFRVPLGVLQLQLIRQGLVLRDSHHQRVAARDGDRRRRGRRNPAALFPLSNRAAAAVGRSPPQPGRHTRGSVAWGHLCARRNSYTTGPVSGTGEESTLVFFCRMMVNSRLSCCTAARLSGSGAPRGTSFGPAEVSMHSPRARKHGVVATRHQSGGKLFGGRRRAADGTPAGYRRPLKPPAKSSSRPLRVPAGR